MSERINKVLYTVDQRGDTTAAEKKMARDNIGAISADEIPSPSSTLEWQQTVQGIENTYEADKLTIHQDTHTVKMHTVNSTDVELGFLVPSITGTQGEARVLSMPANGDVPSWATMPQPGQTGLVRHNAELYLYLSDDGDHYHVRNVVNNAINHVVVYNHTGDICSILVEAPVLGADEEYNYYVVFDCADSSGSCGVDVESASPRILDTSYVTQSFMYIKTALASGASDAIVPEARVTDYEGNAKYVRIDEADYYGMSPNTVLAGPRVVTGVQSEGASYTKETVNFSGAPRYMIHVVGPVWELMVF